MALTLLLDEGLPRSAVQHLRAAGVDAIHVGDIGLAGAADEAVLELGRREGRSVVTLDADFHTLLALSGASAPSVIRIRLEGLRGVELSQLLQRVLAACAHDLARGAAVTVEETRVRVRNLPLRA